MSDDVHEVEPDLLCHSYTTLFSVRKRMRRIGDVPIPVRNGVKNEQVITFLLALLVVGLVYAVVLIPMFKIVGDPPFLLMLFLFLGVPIIASSKIGKPMPNGRTIPGFLGAKVRRLLDDPVHRRGVPVPGRASRGRELVFSRLWVPDPEAGAGEDGARGVPDRVLPGEGEPSGETSLREWLSTQANVEDRKVEAEKQRRVDELAAKRQRTVMNQDFTVAGAED